LTTKMLASTVQFSRYGRSRPDTRGAPPAQARSRTTNRSALSATENPPTVTGRRDPVQQPRKISLPQDPTACLDQPSPHPHVPHPHNESRTSRNRQDNQPTSQRSTHTSTTPTYTSGHGPGRTERILPARRSLERR